MKRRFNLIELVIAVIVIGMLAAIVIPNISSMSEEALQARVENDMRIIQGAVDKYHIDHHEYPLFEGAKLEVGVAANINLKALAPDYLRKIPKDADNFYYWVDWSGKVWIAQIDSPKIQISNGTLKISEDSEDAVYYNLYETNLMKKPEVTSSGTGPTYLKLVKEGFTERILTEKEGIDEGKGYFVSSVDELGNESAPVGVGYEGAVRSTTGISDAFKALYRFGITPPKTTYTIPKQSISKNIFPTQEVTLGDTSDKASYRMEAEDKRVTKNYNNPVSSANHSGGMAQLTTSVNHYFEYDFEGTGVDVLYHSNTSTGTIRVDIDGKEIGRVNTNGQSAFQQKYAVRDIPQGKHKVRVTQIAGSYTYIDAFDVYSENNSPELTNIYTKVLTGSNESLSNNNVIIPSSNQSAAKTYFTLSRDGKTTAKITNSEGEIVRVLIQDKSLNGGSSSEHSVTWDARNDEGIIVPKGYYTLHIYSIGVDGDSSVEHKVSITVDDSKPIYRMEAEDKRVTKNYNNPVSSANHSGGMAQLTTSVSHYFEYEFEGTGVDVLYHRNTSTGTIRIDIDGKEVGRVDTNGTSAFQQKYAIRNLEEGTHKVRVTQIAGSYTYIDSFDIFYPNTAPKIENLKSYSMISGMKTISQSNVLTLEGDTSHNELKFEYTLTYNGYTTAQIRDKNGTLIRTIATNLYQTGGTKKDNILSWDGKNDKGVFVNTGKYTLVLQSKGIEGQVRQPLPFYITVDNEEKSYRMEAEDKRVIKNYNNPVSSANHSGGMAQLTTSVNHYFEYEFEGTGVDVLYHSNTSTGTIRIDIDGKEVGRVNTNGQSAFQQKYAVRDIPQGNHKVRVTQIAGSYTYIDAFDIYNPIGEPIFEAIHTTAIINGKETLSESNVITGNGHSLLKLHYNLDLDSFVNIQVLNNQGSPVRTLHKNVWKTGGTKNYHNVMWDGKNDNGHNVPTGKYTFSIEGESIHKVKTQNYTAQITVDRSKYSYRMEAEDKQVTKNYNNPVSSANHSGGMAQLTTSLSHYLEYEFEGTGVDVLYHRNTSTGTIRIDIDGKEVGRVDTNGSTSFKEDFSIRNLEEGTHTIRVTQIAGSYTYIDAFNIYQ